MDRGFLTQYFRVPEEPADSSSTEPATGATGFMWMCLLCISPGTSAWCVSVCSSKNKNVFKESERGDMKWLLHLHRWYGTLTLTWYINKYTSSLEDIPNNNRNDQCCFVRPCNHFCLLTCPIWFLTSNSKQNIIYRNNQDLNNVKSQCEFHCHWTVSGCGYMMPCPLVSLLVRDSGKYST